jgi:hypothetical protein
MQEEFKIEKRVARRNGAHPKEPEKALFVCWRPLQNPPELPKNSHAAHRPQKGAVGGRVSFPWAADDGHSSWHAPHQGGPRVRMLRLELVTTIPDSYCGKEKNYQSILPADDFIEDHGSKKAPPPNSVIFCQRRTEGL